MKTIAQKDVVIIGSGGAGLRAAIAAHDAGASVLVISKTMHRKSHTVMAEGGIAAALGNVDKKDNWKVHAKDTYEDGLTIGNRKMIEMYAKEAPERLLELDNWGAVFDRTEEGYISQRAFGAHTYKRVCHVEDRTGLEIVQTLADQCRKRKVEYLEEFVVTNLLVQDKKVVGLTGVDMQKGRFGVISAKAVILCTGGYARIYNITTNPWDCTGDGYAFAYNHGVELMDMEMVQFHPTGMVFPESAKGILVTESVRGDGGLLTNSKGERFMEKYDKERMELSARDVVARANHQEIIEGKGSEHGGVYLDISHKPKDYILKKLPKMVSQFKDFANVDITSGPMEVAPTAHYTMGGIKVEEEKCMTSLSGLFAAGETAVSIHGANRLGGNSLSDLLVFGRRAGLGAAAYASKQKYVEPLKKDIEKEHERILKPFSNKHGVRAQQLKIDITAIMEKHVGIVRDGGGLLEAQKKLLGIRKQLSNVSVSGDLKFNHSFHDFIDVHNMLVCGEATVMGALVREESRGAHTRKDYPKTDAKWHVNISVFKGKKGMETKKHLLPKKDPGWAA